MIVVGVFLKVTRKSKKRTIFFIFIVIRSTNTFYIHNENKSPDANIFIEPDTTCSMESLLSGAPVPSGSASALPSPGLNLIQECCLVPLNNSQPLEMSQEALSKKLGEAIA